MRPSRDLLLVLILFTVLIGVTVWGALRQREIEEAQETFTAYSTHTASRLTPRSTTASSASPRNSFARSIA